jgi:predicted secreted Zn-dependent protease
LATRWAALALLAAVHMPGQAGVAETREKRLYDVHQAPGMSLLQALNRASPIREGGQVFHGYTEWRLQWNYRYRERPDGACAITSIDIQLSVAMTLPELKQADAEGAGQFATYLRNLVEHEEGHVRIGQTAARALDTAIAQLPPMPSCPLLEREIARLGNDTLDRARRDNKAYDAATKHGCTQGACLTR